MTFEDDLKAEFEAPPSTEDVEVLLKGTVYKFRFTQMDGYEWASACDQAPPRITVALDRYFNYNIRTVTLIAAPLSGKRVDGDELVDLTPDQWRNLLKALPGESFQRISDALFKLNQIAPAEAVEEAKKASTVEPKKNSA
jgi:hypothetical protein